MNSRSASEWVNAYDSIHQKLTVKGFKPKLQTIVNEASAALKNFFTVNNIAYQLVPPHCHRRNAAERAIRTFKEHFVAGLSSVDPSFPMHLWDRLLPQAEITLNLLRASRLHPQLSAAARWTDFVCIHSSLLPRTTMDSWITTIHLLLRQDAKSSPTRNQESGELGLLTVSMDIHLVPPCIITGVKMYTSRQRPATASWILSNYFPTLIKCHSYHPPTSYSWQPKI
jgi:hypothetical protein